MAFGHPSFGEFAAGWAEETWQKLGVCRLSTAIPKKMETTFAILNILYTSYRSFCLEKKAIGLVTSSNLVDHNLSIYSLNPHLFVYLYISNCASALEAGPPSNFHLAEAQPGKL